MTSGQISTILDQASPPLLGVIATLQASGSPHAVPVWYAWDGHAVSIWTGRQRAWVRNLHREPRVAFTAQQAQPPYAASTRSPSAAGAADTESGQGNAPPARGAPSEPTRNGQLHRFWCTHEARRHRARHVRAPAPT